MDRAGRNEQHRGSAEEAGADSSISPGCWLFSSPLCLPVILYHINKMQSCVLLIKLPLLNIRNSP